MNLPLLGIHLVFLVQPAQSTPTDAGWIQCSDRQNLERNKGEFDYAAEVEKELKKLLPEARSISCTSCYRSASRQGDICFRLCGNRDGCPNRCARPGGSDHQKLEFATCDITGLSNPRKGCEALFRYCTQIVKPELRGKCGIGGYASGSHHFSIGAGQTNPRAWNQCADFAASLKAGAAQGGAHRSPTFMDKVWGRGGNLWREYARPSAEDDYEESNDD